MLVRNCTASLASKRLRPAVRVTFRSASRAHYGTTARNRAWTGTQISKSDITAEKRANKISMAELTEELAELDAELDQAKTRLANFLKNTFNVQVNNPDLFITGLTHLSHRDNRAHNKSLYLVGRRFLMLLAVDSSIAESLQANPNETVNAPREEDYNQVVNAKFFPWFSIPRLRRQLHILGLEPFVRCSEIRRKQSEIKAMSPSEFNNHRELQDAMYAETMVAFMGALFLDQGESKAREFFQEHVLRYGR